MDKLMFIPWSIYMDVGKEIVQF
ncbi:rCG27302 [Rattus norvegicus]|uniref:RCG27302 n=1 Tax=Rattus norvegicus TaxID=10116 RepID=A6HMD4_RAT|nr:rCG27302 [Rattus norvegicus]